jgi:hypothetical protein
LIESEVEKGASACDSASGLNPEARARVVVFRIELDQGVTGGGIKTLETMSWESCEESRAFLTLRLGRSLALPVF